MHSPAAPPVLREAVEEFNAGMVGLNRVALAAPAAPSGGTKSGRGREGGFEAISDYLDVKLAQMMTV